MRIIAEAKQGGREVLETPSPGPGQALVRVEAAGVNFFEFRTLTIAKKTLYQRLCNK